MKTIHDSFNKVTLIAYQDQDLAKLAPTIEKARELWTRLCAETYARRGDIGSCVLGAGLQVRYAAPRKRSYSFKTIITASEVCCAQGSLVWEESVKEVIEFLKENGIEASYNPGYMD